jgi:hypothetical protein
MATRPLRPALLVVALFSRHEEALGWGRRRLAEAYGPVALEGEPYCFNQTSYYQASMGAELRKQLIAFHNLVDPGRLADIKRWTNHLEAELAEAHTYPEPRPVNLDPGLLELGKFVLATTKDQAHRIYLREGIFAEVTLRYQEGAFCPWPWTYADYRQPCVLDFLQRARDYYRQRLAEASSGGGG